MKTTSLKSQKIYIFPKWLTDGFGPKMAILSNLFFLQYRPGKVLLRYSKTKKRLSRLKTHDIKKSRKIPIYPKALTHGFGPKITIFQTFIFVQYRLRKCLLRYSRTKKKPF